MMTNILAAFLRQPLLHWILLASLTSLKEVKASEGAPASEGAIVYCVFVCLCILKLQKKQKNEKNETMLHVNSPRNVTFIGQEIA
jgi:hypothetical protein